MIAKYSCLRLNSLYNLQRSNLKSTINSEGKKFLRDYCEGDLKKQQASYFSDPTFPNRMLNLCDIQTFVINQHFFIVVFQPYIAGSYTDGPFVVKIPFESLKNRWNASHPFCKVLAHVIASKNYVSSWDARDFQLMLSRCSKTPQRKVTRPELKL